MGKDKRITVRLYPHEYKDIEEYCNSFKEPISVSDFVRTAINNELERIKNPELSNPISNQIAMTKSNNLETEKINEKLSLLISKIQKLTEINQLILSKSIELSSQLDEIDDSENIIMCMARIVINHMTKKRQTFESGIGVDFETFAKECNQEIADIEDIIFNTKYFIQMKEGFGIDQSKLKEDGYL